MASTYIKLGSGGAVTWKDAVPTTAQLPTSGNATGDARIVVSPASMYVWNGSAWEDVSGGGGGGSPGGPAQAVQYNDGAALAGDNNFKWNAAEKQVELNGLAVKALSSTISLVDGQGSPVTAFSFSATSAHYSIIEYSIERNGEFQVGHMFIANNDTIVSITDVKADTVDLGFTFSAVISLSTVNIQYTSTASGFNGFLRYHMRQWS